MKARRANERKISAQSCPVSGVDRPASRTMVPPILLTQNRHPHRRWRGRFAVLDPGRPTPGATSCLTGSGGQNDNSAAYRRTACRARMERRPCRNPADQGRTEGCPGPAGSQKAGGLTAGRGRRREASLHLSPVRNRAKIMGKGGVSKGRRVRQDKRNGTMPFGHRAITPCLHIVFSGSRYGATPRCMAPTLYQPIVLYRYSMALCPFCRVFPSRGGSHGKG